MNASSIFNRVIIIVFAIVFITAGIQLKSEAQSAKTKNEIDTYIKEVGGTAPDWWDSVELSYPETLDVNWPVQERFLQGRPGFEERGGRGFRGERRGRGFPGDRMGRGFPGERGGRGFPGDRMGRGFRGDRMGRGFSGERGGRGFPSERDGRGFPGEREGQGRPVEERGWPDERGGRVFGQGQNSQIMVDQYLFQVVYPNPSRHKEGIKLVNHLMIINKDDKEKLKRSLNTLGQMFYVFLDDYTRAAFWWQKYAEMGGSIDSLKMARCYFELGSKSTASDLLNQAGSSYSRNNKDLIKLWAKIGEVDKALEMIESNSDSNNSGMGRFGRRGRMGLTQSDKYLLSAEICRGAGLYDDAIAYYEKVLALPDSETRPIDHHETDDKSQAYVNLAAAKLLKKLDLRRVPDGTHTAVVEAYGGPMTVEVVFKGGNIESVEVTRHWETYSYLIMALPTARQIVTKHGFEGVDVITGATVTSDAIINATAKALFNAMR